ncbi:SDR family NAD(P)-dependent oxidoreductase [Mycobacterium scrofulaceum]|uniref:Short-chain dehydrogenase n=1 Tax=Mycobacterium scrofulaceum TaxID=1783 RepID=A0A1X0KC29_MYCSC|nr:SDR family NAD(P)-dependent oxidoreductase [Mycobacterium scrofulaceum]ORB72573.1 short-chain dehydrogenase [Mycobacterium scrofulaceum]
MKELTGKTALVTGASGGIGRAICLALADAGAAVVVSGRQRGALEELVVELRTKGSRARAIPIDLRDAAAADDLLGSVERDVGPADILVNNAGVEQPAAFTDMTPDDIRTMVEVNLTATMLLTHRVLPGMLNRGRGHIVFVSSGLAKMGSAYQVPYSATKAALLALTQALRAEYRHTPVGFSVVCPGLVTGAGMYQRMLDNGFAASPLLGTTTTTRVARKIVAAIRHDRPEVHVTGAPVRPIAAAIALNPRLAEMITDRAGMTELFRRVAAGRAETNKT